eukprot:7381552-Prymnesium_polylepis.1
MQKGAAGKQKATAEPADTQPGKRGRGGGGRGGRPAGARGLGRGLGTAVQTDLFGKPIQAASIASLVGARAPVAIESVLAFDSAFSSKAVETHHYSRP